jgi:NADPH2:quinone reductase
MGKNIMKALSVSELAEDFAGCSIVDIDRPPPQNGQILVQIRAAAIGFPDLLMTQGLYQHKPNLPFIPGTEIAGDIVALGDGVEGFTVGQAVVASKLGGGLAEYGVFEAATSRLKPDNLSYAQAAATTSAYLTAYVSLVRRGYLQKDEWLLVHGAAGGVGLAAVDLAHHLGAKVIAVASSDEKLAKIKAHVPVEAALNSQNGFREQVKEITGGMGADIIYDPVGGDVFDESVRCIAWGGRLLVVGFASGRIPNISANMPLIKGFSVVGVRAGEYGRRAPQAGIENMAAVWDLAAQGKITPYVDCELPLSQWRDAFARMENRQLVGRVIVDPSRF